MACAGQGFVLLLQVRVHALPATLQQHALEHTSKWKQLHTFSLCFWFPSHNMVSSPEGDFTLLLGHCLVIRLCLFALQASEDTYLLLGPLQTEFELRESVDVKGKGRMRTYVLQEHVADELIEMSM